MKNILITAFEPFGEDSINPTQEILKALPDVISVSGSAGEENAGAARPENSVQIAKLLLPVSFSAAPEMAIDMIEKIRPDAVISLGLAGGRPAVTVERIAVNCMDARIADNDGNSPCDDPVVLGGPAAYFATLPIKEIVTAMQAEGVPSAVSNSAGTYVCNAVMYRILHHAADFQKHMLCGFIHVPYSESMGKDPFLKLEDEIRAVKTAIRVCLRKTAKIC